MSLKCCMCTEEIEGGYDVMIAHMTNHHNLNFNDKEDMNRRLQAIGFDPITEAPKPPSNVRSLYG